MKKIGLFIPDRRLDDVIEVLKDANIGGMSKPKFIPRTKVEVVVSDEKVERLITAFRNKLGDNIGGKLFVIEVHKAVGLSTGKMDENAI
jgi:nitrogen regulatory protein PII